MGAAAIISRQHAEIIIEAIGDFRRPAHCRAAQLRMQVAEMQDREAVERAGKLGEADDVAPQLHLARVRQAEPVGSGHAKRYLNEDLHQRQVLEMQKAQPLAKSLRLVLTLHSEAELRVERSEPGFETPQRFVRIEQAVRGHVVRSRRRRPRRLGRAAR